MTVDIDRYESPTPVRGRRRSLTPGGSTSWITGGDSAVTSVTRSRSRGRRGSVASQSPSVSRSRRGTNVNANNPSVYSEPLWFAHTSESLQSGHSSRPSVRHHEGYADQRAHSPAKAAVPLHLKGTEDQWFKNSYEAFADDMRKRDMEMQRKQYTASLNEHQYQLHKLHDDMQKAQIDTCEKSIKGIAVHPRKLEDTAHHHGNLWFGSVGESSYGGSVPSTRGGSPSTSRRRSITPSRKRAVPLQAVSPNVTHMSRQTLDKLYSHQQYKLDSMKSMQDADRAGSRRSHKKLFPNPQTQHTAIEPMPLHPSTHKTVAPYGTSSPLVADRTRRMQQLGEALSSYRERTRTHL